MTISDDLRARAEALQTEALQLSLFVRGSDEERRTRWIIRAERFITEASSVVHALLAEQPRGALRGAEQPQQPQEMGADSHGGMPADGSAQNEQLDLRCMCSACEKRTKETYTLRWSVESREPVATETGSRQA